MQEEAEHLLDIEPIMPERLDQLISGEQVLRAAARCSDLLPPLRLDGRPRAVPFLFPLERRLSVPLRRLSLGIPVLGIAVQQSHPDRVRAPTGHHSQHDCADRLPSWLL
jgi:hypothetical protein